MRKITDIYEEYKIMPNLQMHQLRVTAVALQICNSLNVEIDKEVITKASLLHDMGNIIKFDLTYTMREFPEFFEPNGFDYWQKVKDEYISKYGINEHEATVKIILELGLSDGIADLANQNRFSFLCNHVYLDDMMIKIIHYSDMRAGPHGIISYEERMEDGAKRYRSRPDFGVEEERNKLIACGKEIEKQIFSQSNIKPEDINDESVASTIEKLRDFEI